MIEIPGFTPIRRVKKTDDGHVLVYVQPPPTIGNYPEACVKLTAEQYGRYELWRFGVELIQDALPELSLDVREQLMTGLCDKDFHRITRDPEED